MPEATAVRLFAENQGKAKVFEKDFPKVDETQQLLHKLQVQQVELELQNGELRKARNEVEEALEKYTDLYEFAPLGYFTLSRTGVIRAVNLTGAALLGIARPRLLGRSFGLFVAEEARPLLFEFVEEVFARQGMQSCEVTLIREGRRPLFVQLDANALDSKVECRVAVIDLSERRSFEDSLRAQQEQLADLAAELSLAEERERRRIAGELHDQIGQTLAFSKIKLDVLLQALESTDQSGQVRQVRDAITTAIYEVRTLTFQVSPPLLYEVGFEAAVEWLCDWALDTYGLEVEFHEDRQPKEMGEAIRGTLFQAVRELLINIAKHAQTNKASISIKKDGFSLIVLVEDQGIGFVVTTAAIKRESRSGFGLFNVRQRIGHLGGELYVNSEVGRGTSVKVVVPLSAPDGRAPRKINGALEEKQDGN